MIRSFLVNADGSVSVCKEEAVAQTRQSKLPEIIELLKAGKPAEASRLVSIELAKGAIDTRECKSETELRACEQQRKVLCALSEFICKPEAPAERDVLNVDGPKFQWFLGEAVMMFKRAAEEALGKGREDVVDKIMKDIEDRLEAGMPELRRRMETIDLSTGTDASKNDDGENGPERSE
jgi:hypothetical protein